MNLGIYIWWVSIFKLVGIIFANSCILLLGNDGWFDPAFLFLVLLLLPAFLFLVLWQSWVGFEFLSLLIDDSSGDIHCSRTIDIGFGVWCLLGREETLFHHQHLLRCRLCTLLINASSCFLFAFTCFPSLSLSLCFPSHKPLMSVFCSYFFIIFFPSSAGSLSIELEQR